MLAEDFASRVSGIFLDSQQRARLAGQLHEIEDTLHELSKIRIDRSTELAPKLGISRHGLGDDDVVFWMADARPARYRGP